MKAVICPLGILPVLHYILIQSGPLFFFCQSEIHMSEEAIQDILEQTESDPAFQALFDLFDYGKETIPGQLEEKSSNFFGPLTRLKQRSQSIWKKVLFSSKQTHGYESGVGVIFSINFSCKKWRTFCIFCWHYCQSTEIGWGQLLHIHYTKHNWIILKGYKRLALPSILWSCAVVL